MSYRPVVSRSKSLACLYSVLVVLALSAAGAHAQAPATPTGVAATPADQSVIIAWLASSGATSYNLYRSLVTGQEGTIAYRTGINGVSSSDTGLANGTRYYYKVSALNASGESAQSTEVSSISGSPSVPGSLSAIPGNNQVSLFWSASSTGGATTTYNIYIGLSAGGEGSTASVTSVRTPSWGHYGASNGTIYYYQVSAKNAFGESSRTAEISGTPVVGVPAPPAGLSLTPSSTQIALAWSPVSTATSYKVYRALAAGGPFTVIGLPSSTSFTNTGLTNGATYWYYLTAVSSFGESSASGTRSGVSNPAPPAPAGLSGVPGIGSVSLTWTASTGAVSYNLYRSTDGLTFSAAGSTTATTYLDSPLSQGTPYWYYVSAVGPTGSESGLSNEITITTSSVITVGACGTPPPQGWLYVSTSTVRLSPVTTVWMSEISLSPVIKVQWSGVAGCNVHYQWSRTGGGTSASGDTVATSFRDGFNFTTGTTYTYSITAVSGGTSWSTGTVGGNLWYYGTSYTASNPVSIQVTPRITSVTDNQTADARYDLRFGNPTFLDYPFATGIYKGGLYVGNATDPSRMGRSFLRFSPPGAGSGVWAGSISAYFTGSFTSVGNIPVGCQGVLDNGWTSSNLKWSTAPALTPTAARNTSLVTYSTNNPIGYWVRWPLDGVLWNQLVGGTPLVAALAVTTEASDQTNSINDWLYFAKKEFTSAPSATLLYATGAPGGAVWLTLAPASVQGGSSAVGTVFMNGVAGVGGLAVSLSSDNTTVATVPASVTIPQGYSSASFTVTTVTVGTSTTVNITASATAPPVTAPLVVTP